MARKPKPGVHGHDTMMLGDHRVAVANGLCVPDCPACLRGDRNEKIFFAVLGIAVIISMCCH